VTLEAEIEEMLGTSGLPTAWNRFSFRASIKNQLLCQPWKCDKIKLCCFKPPSLLWFITASLRNKYIIHPFFFGINFRNHISMLNGSIIILNHSS
jgi:hypothetical protein